jgi:hypothetical protein
MYTAIPHDLLCESIDIATKEAFGFAAAESQADVEATRLAWKPGSVRWVRHSKSLHSSRSHTLTQGELMELVRFLVANTYLSNGSSLRRQAVGIPMGTNCAPALANLFLYRYEAAYIDQLAERSLVHARRFHATFRLIDDVLSVDNALWAEAVGKTVEAGGLYPAALALNQTNNAPHSAEFLGMSLTVQGSRFHLSVFDKRASFPFDVRRYPHVASLIPVTIPYGVFTGQLHRGWRICSRASDFLSFALEVAARLQRNGCRKQQLRNRFRAFVFRQPRKFEGARPSSLSAQFSRSLGS